MIQRAICRNSIKVTMALVRLVAATALVVFLAMLDYVSTSYAFLELSGNKYFSEGGSLANWALKQGGFSRLFWIDVAAASALVLLAVTA